MTETNDQWLMLAEQASKAATILAKSVDSKNYHISRNICDLIFNVVSLYEKEGNTRKAFFVKGIATNLDKFCNKAETFHIYGDGREPKTRSSGLGLLFARKSINDRQLKAGNWLIETITALKSSDVPALDLEKIKNSTCGYFGHFIDLDARKDSETRTTIIIEWEKSFAQKSVCGTIQTLTYPVIIAQLVLDGLSASGLASSMGLRGRAGPTTLLNILKEELDQLADLIERNMGAKP